MSLMYNTGILALTNGTVIWGTSDMRCMLVAAYTFDVAQQYLSDVAAFEITQGGRGTLAGMVVVPDVVNNRTKFDATDLTYTTLAAGDTPTSAIIYKYNVADASAELLCYIPLVGGVAPDGSDYVVSWNSDGLFIITTTGISDPAAIHVSVAAEISTLTEKIVPVSSDVVFIEDSGDSSNKKKVKVGNLPSVIGDTAAIHDNVAAEISVITEKVIPVATDLLVIEDSADSNNKKRIQIGNLPVVAGTGGDIVEMLNVHPAANRSTNSAVFVGIGVAVVPEPGDIIGSFVAATTGKYLITLRLNAYGAGSTYWFHVRVVFDYAAVPIIVGGGADWFGTFYNNDARNYSFAGIVSLVAGAHTVKCEWQVPGSLATVGTYAQLSVGNLVNWSITAVGI